ncbi:MAG: undecaprenyl-diphosphate phosphatase [Spirochaetes bacterium]|nr:undecaprenyl-diphosphate phosphatase [Spirochaetota bacterium]
MIFIKALLVSIIQGFTEFLPISSSGHIFLSKFIINLDIDATFDVILHLGSLFAVIIFYRIEIYELIAGLFKKNIQSKLFNADLSKALVLKIWLLFIIATIPAVIAGYFLEDFFDFEPSSTPKWYFLLLGSCFLLTAFFLILTKFIKKNNKKLVELSILDSLIIGIFQAIGVLYGVSRSGSTISSALYLKVNRVDAARFSFLLSIPLIIGASLLKIFKLIKNFKSDEILMMSGSNYFLIMLIGIIGAFISGFIALKLLIKLIKTGKFWIFSIYLIIPIAVCLYFYLT